MNEAVAKALDKLESGKWDAAKALASIETGSKPRKKKGSSWLRVRIVEDGKKKFAFRLPFGAISLLVTALNPIVKWGLRHAAKKHGADKLPDISKLDLRRILETLRSCGPLLVVDLKDDKTEVLIQTM